MGFECGGWELAEVRNGIAPPVGDTFDGLNVSSEWGDRLLFETTQGKTKSGHTGMDFVAPRGTRVNAVADGIVERTGDNPKGYGKYTIIKHKTGARTLYAYQDTITVDEGDSVKAGQSIGTVGSTGKTTGDHLHLGFDGNGDGEFSNDNPADNPATILYTGVLR